MTNPPPHSASYFVRPEPEDFRQGDVYRDVVHLMWSSLGFKVLRSFTAKGGQAAFTSHDQDNPPKGGFTWDSKESVEAEGQLRTAIVLTHDCEIENDDSRSHRLVGMLRPFEILNDDDKQVIIEGRHYGRLYLPSWPDAGIPESYVDFRRITTLREGALPDENRIASMTDFGRELLQTAVIQYITEKYRG